MQGEFIIEQSAQKLVAFTVVLTGGIASGKSAVSALFSELGVPVVDTDIIARTLVNVGQPALEAILEQFGPQFALPDGGLDRKKLRNAVFSNPDLKKRLEKILHPLIAAKVIDQVQSLTCNYCVVVVPLLAETPGFIKADRVLVVDVPQHIQISRLMKRDSISRQLALSIIAGQATREDRLALADDVIENTGDFAALRARVEALHWTYLNLAKR